MLFLQLYVNLYCLLSGAIVAERAYSNSRDSRLRNWSGCSGYYPYMDQNLHCAQAGTSIAHEN